MDNDGKAISAHETANNSDNILQEIVDKLLSMKHTKNWKKKNLTYKSLFNEYLCSTEVIERAFKHDELDVIAEVFAKHTGGSRAFKKNALKATKVNCISCNFGDKSTISRTKRKVGKPKTLAGMSKNFIMKPTYPKDVLVSSVCRIHYIEKGKEFEESTKIPMTYHIEGTNKIHKAYCFPDYSKKRHQLEPRILDPTNILTSMCVHCTKKNLQDCLCSSFLHISQRDIVLEGSIIMQLLDKQSASIAVTFFSKEVEDVMRQIEDEDKASENEKDPAYRKKIVCSSYFVKCICYWYFACDSRGYTPIQRIEMLQEFYDLLTNDVDFSSFPPPSGYVKGIPIVIYEAILQNTTLYIFIQWDWLPKINIYSKINGTCDVAVSP